MDDLISRQKAIEAIDKYFDGLPIQGYYDMVRIIKNLPTIEPKHCKWKHDADGLIWCYGCGFGKERSDDRPYNYCPNCGAKMESE